MQRQRTQYKLGVILLSASPRPPNALAALPLTGLALLLVIGPGCQEERIQVYQAPKDASARDQRAASDPVPETPEETPQWQLPAGWEVRASAGMRSATFAILGSDGLSAEVSIMPFKRMGGSDLDFVNLWRSTLGLDPVDDSRLNSMVQTVPIGTDSGKLYDVLDNPAEPTHGKGAHILVARVVRGSTSWFFKLAGDAALVESQKEPFKEFLKSISFKASPPIAQASANPPLQSPSAAPRPRWETPPHWKELPPSSMLLAKFQLGDPQSDSAEVTVSAFPGDVGGLLANVNRWRGQVGLPPLQEPELPTHTSLLDLPGGKATLVDASGTDPKTGRTARLIGAILPQGKQTWFYKMMGDPALAAQEKDAFLKFIQSVRYPNA